MSSSTDRENRDSGAGSINDLKFKYCRLCGVELICGVFIYGEEGRRLQLADKIRKTLSILVLEEDILPKKICTDCCTSLEDYSKYKDTVSDAQAKLAAIAKLAFDPTRHGPHQRSASQPSSMCSSAREEIDGGNAKGAIVPPPTPAPSISQMCEFCGTGFSNKDELDNHISVEHASSSPQSQRSSITHGEVEAIELHILSPITPSDEPLLVEEEQRTVEVNSSPETPRGPPIINLVPASRVSTSTTSQVKTKTEKTHHCAECNLTLAGAGAYYNHRMAHKGRRFVCPHCSVPYTTKHSLKHHMESVHTTVITANERAGTSRTRTRQPSPTTSTPSEEFKCAQCEASFYTKRRLVQHSQTHATARPYECPVCHKFFKTNKCLRTHKVTHKPVNQAPVYPCPQCPKKFSRQKNLGEHEKRCHSAMKFVCGFCQVSFNVRANYIKHVRRRHPEKLDKHRNPPKPTEVPKGTTEKAGRTNQQNQSSAGQNQEELHPPSTSGITSFTPTFTSSNVGSGPMSQHAEAQAQTNAWNQNITQTEQSNRASMAHHQSPGRHQNQIHPSPANFTQQQSQTHVQNQHQHNSIPIIPMDDMVDCVIQSALMSHTENSSQSGSHQSSPIPMQAYHQHHQRLTNTNHMSSNPGSSIAVSYNTMQHNDLNRSAYLTQFDETPLELCVRNNDDEAALNDANQLVDLTSAKIVDLSGVGLVMAAQSGSNSQGQSTQSTSSHNSNAMYRPHPQQSHLHTMTNIMQHMSAMPMDLTDQQQQASSALDNSGHIQNLHNNQIPMQQLRSTNDNLVDLSYTGNTNRTNNNHFQMQQQSQSDQDDQLSTSTFLRELLDLSCSTSTTNGKAASTSGTMDTFSLQSPQAHFQSQTQQTYQQPQQSFQQASSQHPANEIQQYELNLSSKSRGFGMGPYQSHTSQPQPHNSHNQHANTSTMYQLNQAHSNNTSPGRSAANNQSSSSHYTVYNESMFM